MSWTNQQKTVAGVLLAVVVVLAAALIFVSIQIRNVGTINTIGFNLWADSARTTKLTSIDWGNFNPGDTHGVVGWAQNAGNTNFTLAYVVSNWNPASGASYLVFSWNYTGAVVHPNDVVPIEMTLKALLNVTNTGITNFSFDVNMTATQV
jgi:hypothetical protein